MKGENIMIPCPNYTVALLREISRVLSLVMWNRYQKEYESPFDNTGTVFKCEKFEVYSYDWSEESDQKYNFIYFVDKTKTKLDDIKISWYKYLGRDTEINQDLDYETVVSMFNTCIDYLWGFDKQREN